MPTTSPRRALIGATLRTTAALTLVGLSALVATVPVARAADPLEVSLCRTFQPSGNQGAHAWQMDRLRLKEAWALATGEGVTVAVIDTGTSNINSAYFNANDVASLNMIPLDDQDRKDGLDCGHGTQVTSLIASTSGIDARTNFGGVAPDAKVIAYRGLAVPVDEQGNAQAESPAPTIAAVNEAIAAKVDIINISQAMSEGTPEYAAAIKNAIDHGIVVVAAAGNASQKLRGPAYPASYPGVIAVGLSNPQDIAPAGSGHSDPAMEITVAAPGVGVLALGPTRAPAAGRTSQQDLLANQSYVSETGTSFSAPIVSGVVALMLQRSPDLTPAQVKQRLVETADPPVGSVPDPYLGHGVVNPLRALTGPAAPTAGHPSSSTSPEAVPPRQTVATDRSGLTTALVATAGALLLAGGGLLLKLVIPAADKRGYRAAAPERHRD